MSRLQEKLLNLVSFDDEGAFEQTLHALLATAFAGKPTMAGTTFAALNDQQQSAIRTIAQVDAVWWDLGCMIQDLLMSYGFTFWDKESLARASCRRASGTISSSDINASKARSSVA